MADTGVTQTLSVIFKHRFRHYSSPAHHFRDNERILRNFPYHALVEKMEKNRALPSENGLKTV